jgi:hypothetical protein
MAAAFGAAFLATLGMDGSLHYPLAYPQVLLAAIALLFIASAIRDRSEPPTSSSAPDAAGGPLVVWLTMALCAAYAASWTVIGFFPATFIYVAAQLWLLRQRHWAFLLGVPACVILIMYVVFDKLLAMPFPSAAW